MTYRGKHVTQLDGSRLQFSNCRMAVLATHLDYHTHGEKTSTGAIMRDLGDDLVGGTDSGDALKSWARGYGETLVIRDGSTWERLVSDRDLGRFISLDVLYSELSDRCQSASSFGHTIGIAPESRQGKWLVSDPLCKAYKYMHPSELRAAAEAWGTRVFRMGFSARTHGVEYPYRMLPQPTTATETPVASGSGIWVLGKTGGAGSPISQRIRYTTSVTHGEGESMQGFTFDDNAQVGRIVVQGTDHMYQDLETGKLVPIPADTVKRAFGPVMLKKGIGADTDDRRKAYIIGKSAAAVLASDVVFQVDAGDPKEIARKRDAQWIERLTPPPAT